MIIQYASDLHLEFPENKAFLSREPIKPLGDVLLLAGDIVPFAVLDKHKDFFNYVSDHFETVYWVPGNHEYYHSNINKRSGVLYEKIRSNVFLVNNFSVNHGHTKLIFSTLWSKIRPEYQWQIERGMSDFHVIRNNFFHLTADKYNSLHEDSVKFIQKKLAHAKMEKTVIISHHVPTFLNYPKKYKGSVLSDAFAVELFDFIENTKPDYWIYGHTHSNTPNFKIGQAQLLTNQLGYVRYGEQSGYHNDRIIEIP